MCQDPLLVFQLHPDAQVRKELHNNGLNFRGFAHGRVKTHGPFAVTATQCSKCAEGDPSVVTAVQWSDRILVSGFPRFTMGSIARTIPSFSRGFSFFRST